MSEHPDQETRLYAEKKELRKVMTARLKAITSSERERRSQAAATLVTGLPTWTNAQLVLAFLSMPSEIDTLPVIELALKAGKRVAVPRIDDGDLAFIELQGSWRDWPRDRWNIPTPPAEAPVLSAELIASLPCLALVPGLAFDHVGGRLGRGKGYYDRFLSSVQAAAVKATQNSVPGTFDSKAVFTTAAYGYDFQEVQIVPMGLRDVHLQTLILA